MERRQLATTYSIHGWVPPGASTRRVEAFLYVAVAPPALAHSVHVDVRGLKPGRGYFKATVTPRRLDLDLRFVTSVEDPSGVGYTERSFFVEDGVTGAKFA